MAEPADLDDAVAVANAAFKSWSRLSREERCGLLKEFANGLEKHKDALTELLSKESGKPVC